MNGNFRFSLFPQTGLCKQFERVNGPYWRRAQRLWVAARTHAQAHAHTTTSTLEAKCQQQFAESDHSWQLNYFHTADPTRPLLLQKHFTLNSSIFNRVTRSRAVSLQTLVQVLIATTVQSSRDVESAGARGPCIVTIKSHTQNMICENLNSCCFQ